MGKKNMILGVLEISSWNLEPSNEKYRNAIVKKSIEKALIKNRCVEDFDTIAEKFILTEPRYDRKLFQLSGERWRASAALGYSNRRYDIEEIKKMKR